MKRVGKLIGLAGVVAVMMFTVTGCMSLMSSLAKSMIKDYGVYDESVPEGQLCELIFTAVNMRTFNGKPVSWESLTAALNRGSGNMGRIKLPAGTHEFVFDWNWQEQGVYRTTWRTIKNLEISGFEFLPGHRYNLSGNWYGGRAYIYMQDISGVRADMYGDSIPKFPNKSKTPTVLEGNWKGSDTTTFKFAGNEWEMSVPPGIQGNISNVATGQRGIFEIEGGKIVMYVTHAGSGKMWISVSGLKLVNSWPFSVEGGNFNLERPKSSIWTYSFDNNQSKLLKFEEFPQNIVYTKQ